MKVYQGIRNEKKVNVSKFFELKSIIVYIISILVGVVKLPSGATPFGLAAIGAMADAGFPLILPMVIIALVTGITMGGTCLLKFVIASVIFILMRSFVKGNSRMGNAAKVLFSTAISEIIILLGTQTLIYDAVMAAFMSTTTAIFYLVFSEGLPIILEYDQKKITSHETLMAAGILLTVLTCGVGNFSLLGLSIRNIICIFIVLFLGWRRGTTCGIISGLSVSLVLGILGYANASTVATYTVCGLLAGVLSRYGKLGAIVGFVLGNAVWVFYSNASTEIIIPIGEIVVASIALFFLPKRVTHFIDNLFDFENTIEGKDPIAYLAESTIFKLKSVSEVAEDMAANVETETSNANDAMTQWMKSIKENTCQKCSYYEKCWDKNAHAIYDSSFRAMEMMKKENTLTAEKLAISYCDNPTMLLQGMNNAYEILKLNRDWQSKVREDKKLVAKQLRGVSQAIHTVQDAIQETPTTTEEVARLGAGYELQLASSSTHQNGSKVSGDTTLYHQLKDGKLLVALSDGMGSGEMAAKSSEKVLSLLEKYLNTGLEKHVALDMINSYMMLGDNQENYATLDAIVYDKATSQVDMIKLGACPTYVWKDGKVKMISSQSLPVGALSQSSAEIYTDHWERGTVVVMISDGILEANPRKEMWLKELLEKINHNSLQRIADIILQEAVDAGLGIAKDDMSVIVLKVG